MPELLIAQTEHLTKNREIFKGKSQAQKGIACAKALISNRDLISDLIKVLTFSRHVILSFSLSPFFFIPSFLSSSLPLSLPLSLSFPLPSPVVLYLLSFHSEFPSCSSVETIPSSAALLAYSELVIGPFTLIPCSTSYGSFEIASQ